jgi:acetyl esterase/lipase
MMWLDHLHRAAISATIGRIAMRNVIVPLNLAAVLLFSVFFAVLAADAPAGQGVKVMPTGFTPAYANVVYIPGSTNSLHKLDIYTSSVPRPEGGYPLLIFIHGGGFARGDKYGPTNDDFRTAMKGLDKGFMVASVNYRLSGTDKAPAQIVDVKAAIRFLRANGATYGFNPDRIVLMGVSAGSSIAAAAATSSDSSAFDPELAALSAVKSTEKIKAVISLFGLYDFTRLQAQSEWLTDVSNTSFDKVYLPAYTEARKFFLGKKAARFNSPDSMEYKVLGGPLEKSNPMTAKINAITYIGPKEPPFFIRHGGADEAIPFLQSVDLAEALKAQGNRVDFAIVPGAQHGLPMANFFNIFDAEEMYKWLAQQIDG